MSTNKGKGIVGNSKCDVNQLNQAVQDVNLDANEQGGWTKVSRKKNNKGGNVASAIQTPKPNSWFQPGGRGGEQFRPPTNGCANPAGGRGGAVPAPPAIPPPPQNVRNWNSRPNSRPDRRADREIPQPSVILDPYDQRDWPALVKVENIKGRNVAAAASIQAPKPNPWFAEEDVVDESVDDSDEKQKSYEERKKNKWHAEFFITLDKLTVEQINEPDREWHCPACKNGPSAIDLYNSLTSLVTHARTEGTKRVKIHRDLAELLEEELRIIGALMVPPGESYGKGKDLNKAKDGSKTNWLVTQYHTEENPDLGIIKAIRLLDERVFSFNLEEYDIHVEEHRSLELKYTFGNLMLFYVVPNGSLRVLNMSNGNVTRIDNPTPGIAAFRQINEFKMFPDPEHEFRYIIVYEQVINLEDVVHYQYRSFDREWRQVPAQRGVNILEVNTRDSRCMIFEREQLVRFVAFNEDNNAVVFSQAVEQLTNAAFGQDGVFERNEQGQRVMGVFDCLWSRGCHGWYVVVEANNDDPADDVRIRGIVLFRMRENWSQVDFISRMQRGLLPLQGCELTDPLLEVVDGVVHLTFSTRGVGRGPRGILLFSYNPATNGWTSRGTPDLMLAADNSTPVFVTSLNPEYQCHI